MDGEEKLREEAMTLFLKKRNLLIGLQMGLRYKNNPTHDWYKNESTVFKVQLERFPSDIEKPL